MPEWGEPPTPTAAFTNTVRSEAVVHIFGDVSGVLRTKTQRACTSKAISSSIQQINHKPWRRAAIGCAADRCATRHLKRRESATFVSAETSVSVYCAPVERSRYRQMMTQSKVTIHCVSTMRFAFLHLNIETTWLPGSLRLSGECIES